MRKIFLIFIYTFSTISAQPTFTEHAISTAADGAKFVYAADLDGDGDMDVVSASGIDDKIAWYENDGAQNYTEHVISDTANGALSVYAADMDGDGDIDVLSSAYTGNPIIWYENDGNESFTGHVIQESGPGSSRSVYASDLDGDGDMDVLTGLSDNIVWYENDGSQNFDFTYLSWDDSNPGIYSVYAADVDGDGDMDVLSAGDAVGVGDDMLAWHENDGFQNFTDHSISSSTDGNRSVYAADVDGDGDMDVLTACFHADKIAWYKNDGSEGFTEHVISTSADRAYSVYATDVDGDGDMDVLSASEGDDKIAWYENDGSENFTEQVISTSANAAYSVYATDVDGDGDMDVLSASGSDDKIAWYEQDGSPVFETTYVPDDNFEQALIDLGYDDVLDDSVLTVNISGVTYLDVDDKGISDLTGIEGFTAVTDLRIRYNQLTSLDVSNNTALLTIRSNENQLTSINVSNNTALTGLSCAYNNLSELDMSNNPLLDFLECRSNQLTTLDIRNGVTDALTTFDAINNSLTCILVNEEDVDWATENWTHENNNIDEGVIFDPECLPIDYTYIPDDNFEQALIDLGYDDVLDDSVATQNIYNVNELHIGSMDIGDLTGIDGFTNLEYLYSADNTVENIDLSNNIYLNTISLNNNQLTSIDVSNNSSLAVLEIENNQLNSINVSDNNILERLDIGTNQLNSLDVSSNAVLKVLNIRHNQISSLNVSNNLVLEQLNCWENQLTSIDVSNNMELKSLELSYNQLTSLDVSDNIALEYLGCNANDFPALDISQNTQLTFIRASSNNFSSIDLSNNILLELLEADHNLFTNIDLSNNPELREIGLGSNQLNSLDISNNPLLTHISVAGNDLTTLDITNCPELVNLHASNNQLISIDFINNPALEELYCDSNQLTSLDLSNNPLISHVIIGSNQIISLDVSNNTALEGLSISNNQLTSLDLSNNINLRWLYIVNNNLTSLDVSNNPDLLNLNCTYNDLSSLNLKGRHPSEYETVEAYENWSLECVDVLDPYWALDNWEDYFDRDVQFEFICGAEDRSQWHVSADGSNNSGDGSLENPLETIQLAIDISSNGDSVTVGPGVYNENISWFNKNLTIMGAGSEETIIDAQQLDNGVRIQNIGNTSLFEGFKIKNGITVFEDWPWALGGGICMINSHATLRDIIVEDCVLQEQEWQNGNGIFVSGSNSLFENVTVRNNEGGGIALSGADSYPVLNRVLIEGNTNGFGMRVYDTGVIMHDSEVSNNPAGGIWYEGVGFNPSVYTNSLFHNNGSEGSEFGAIKIMNSGGVASFSNCTFYGNQSGTLGSDIYSQGNNWGDSYSGNDITIVNSVFYNEQESSIYLDPTDYADTLNISYSNLLTAESIHSDNVNYIEIGAGMIYGDPMFCDPENGEYSVNVFSPLVDAGSDGGIIGNLEVDCGFEPIITEVTDVPNDQGGWVYLGFSRCVFDQQDITDQLYTIYRYDMVDDYPAWVGLLSIGAIGEEHYYVEVHTNGDSTAEDNGMGTYKVVASMNEGIYHSDEMSGYSVDNIAPDMPTGMQAMAMENSIILNWDMSEAEDFQYFVLERTNEATAGVEASTISYELIDITFEDVDLVRNVEYSYRLAAYDDADNRSEFTGPVSAILLSTDQQSLLPEAYTLHQNYPNPFNPTTQIRYDLPENSYVNINIYDLMGKRVKLLVNSKQDAGYRSIHWNATNNLGQPVSAGMYIYTIQAGEFRQTRKMVLLK